jgi:HEAT repeat protein
MNNRPSLSELELLPPPVFQLVFSALIEELGQASNFDSYENEVFERFCRIFSVKPEEKKASLEKIKSIPKGKTPFSSINYLSKLKSLLIQTKNPGAESITALITEILVAPLDHTEIAERSSIIEQFEHSAPDVRIKAIRDILSSQLPDRMEILLRFFRAEKDIQVKYELRKAINEIESLSITGTADRSEDEKANLSKIRLAMNSSNPEKMRAACAYIIQYQLKEMLPELVELEKKTGDPLLRCTIIRLLKCYGSDGGEKIRSFLNDRDQRVIICALETLESIGDSNSLATVARFIMHKEEAVAKASGRILSKMSPDKSLELIAQLSRSRHAPYREAAACALGLLQIKNSDNILHTLIKDESETVRLRAMEVMQSNQPAPPPAPSPPMPGFHPTPPPLFHAQVPTTATVTATATAENNSFEITVPDFKSNEDAAAWMKSKLARLRNEKEPKIVASGIMLLSQIAGLGEIKMRLLKNFLMHHNSRVRANALEVLQGILPRQHRHIFVSALHDSHNRVIGNAIMGLIAYGSEESGENRVADEFQEQINEALKRLITDNRENYNLTALYCLGILQQEKYLYILQLALSSEHQKVQERAIEILDSWSLVSAKAKKLLTFFRNQELGKIDFSSEEGFDFGFELTPVTDKKNKISSPPVLEKAEEPVPQLDPTNTNMLVIEAYQLLQKVNEKLRKAKKSASDNEIKEFQTTLIGCEDDTAISDFVARFKSGKNGLLIDILKFFCRE